MPSALRARGMFGDLRRAAPPWRLLLPAQTLPTLTRALIGWNVGVWLYLGL